MQALDVYSPLMKAQSGRLILDTTLSSDASLTEKALTEVPNGVAPLMEALNVNSPLIEAQSRSLISDSALMEAVKSNAPLSGKVLS